MVVAAARLWFHIPYSHSLKEKRMVRRSLTDRLRARFNISVAEIDEQDSHQHLVLGIAAVAGTVRLADSVLDTVIAFAEENTEAELLSVEREIR